MRELQAEIARWAGMNVLEHYAAIRRVQAEAARGLIPDQEPEPKLPRTKTAVLSGAREKALMSDGGQEAALDDGIEVRRALLRAGLLPAGRKPSREKRDYRNRPRAAATTASTSADTTQGSDSTSDPSNSSLSAKP
jgi:hypothetical protein